MITHAHAAISGDVLALSQRCAPSVHPVTMAYVVNAESSNNPFAIGINDGPALAHQPRNKQEAVTTARRLLAEGRSFDSGLGQINSGNLAGLSLEVEDLFDPCRNLRAAAVILGDCYRRASAAGKGSEQARLRQALSCYNTNSLKRGFSNGYVKRVTQQLAYSVPRLVAQESLPAGRGARPSARSPSTRGQGGGESGDIFDHADPGVFNQPEPKTNAQDSVNEDDNRSAENASFMGAVRVSRGGD